jgi:hypothetical protein
LDTLSLHDALPIWENSSLCFIIITEHTDVQSVLLRRDICVVVMSRGFRKARNKNGARAEKKNWPVVRLCILTLVAINRAVANARIGKFRHCKHRSPVHQSPYSKFASKKDA